MKRYVAYIFAVLSLAWMVSCSVDEGLTNPNEAGRVALQFQSSSMTRSAGDDALNENKLVSLDCYFYPTNGTGDDAKWHYRVELKDGAERLDRINLSFNRKLFHKFYLSPKAFQKTVHSAVLP